MPPKKRYEVTVNVNVTLDTWIKLEAVSNVRGRLKSDVVRECISTMLDVAVSRFTEEDRLRYDTLRRELREKGKL